jgi:hypothetical protein
MSLKDEWIWYKSPQQRSATEQLAAGKCPPQSSLKRRCWEATRWAAAKILVRKNALGYGAHSANSTASRTFADTKQRSVEARNHSRIDSSLSTWLSRDVPADHAKSNRVRMLSGPATSIPYEPA